MSVNNKTYQPLQAISVRAKEDLPAFRFISHLGTICADGAKSLGITEVDWLKDEMASVITLGTMPVETTTSVNIGDNITSANDGRARKANSNEPVNGRALDSTNGSGFIRVLIVP